MHYKNGREVKVGDQVVGRDSSGGPVAGMVCKVYPGATSCNAQLVPFSQVYQAQSVNCSDLLHVEDALPLPTKAI